MLSRFRHRESHCILIKDYEGKQLVFGKFEATRSDESCTIRPGMYQFDFMLTLSNNLEIGLSLIKSSLPFLERFSFLF